MEDVIALVPMKGHSERISNKNIKDFNGKPLFYWIINELKKAKYIKKIVVNTDSKTIKNKCNYYFPDLEIIKRKKKLCGDYVSMNKIIEQDINYLNENTHFLQTHSTNPLLRSETIDEAMEVYFDKIKKGYDSLFSVNRIQTRCYLNEGKAINHNPTNLKRTQDLEPVFEENSNIYLFSHDSFIKNNNRIGKKPFLFEMEKYESIDIDEKKDFDLAQSLHFIRSEF